MLLPSPLPAGTLGGFTTRTGGLSAAPYSSLNLGLHAGDDPEAVRRNRELLARAVSVPASALVLPQQVHGRGVALVDRPVDGPVPGADAVVTATAGLALVVLAADCVPVLLADPVAGVVAAAHAGRAGLLAGVLQRTVEAMSRLGATPARTTAVVGPAACARCYEVPAELADDVDLALPGTRAVTRRGTPSVDLAAGATVALGQAGVQQVQYVGGCTLEQPEHFFSYRRDGVTGRHGGVVRLDPSRGSGTA